MIYCVGEALVDMMAEEEASLKESSKFLKKPGGAPANVAVAASRLGETVEMVATVGKDEFGEFMIQKLEKEDVGTSNIRKAGEKTTLAFASIDEDSKPHFMFSRGADEKIGAGQLDFEVSEDDTVHLGSLPWTDKEAAKGILRFLDDLDATVSFDPNLRDDLEGEEYRQTLVEIAKKSDILIAAEEEAEFFLDKGVEEEVEEVVVTKGEEGAKMIKPDTIEVEAPKVEVVDTTGAGDAFTGAYLAFRDRGREEALEKAVGVASKSVKSKGAMSSLPRKEELE